MFSIRKQFNALTLTLLLSLPGSVFAELAEVDSAATQGAALQGVTLEGALADAQTALHRSDYATAIRTLETISADGPGWELSFWLGTAYLLDGQLDNAALALDDALTLESGIVDIWVQRAVVAQQRLQPEVALQLLEVAAQVDGDYSLTYLNAAVAYESLGDAANARGAYGRFLQLSAGSGESNRMRRLRRDVLNLIAERSREG